MAWLRVGDNIITHPAMSRILTATAPAENPAGFSHQDKLEAFGAYVLMATVSAAHLTDAVVEYGMLAQVAPGRETAVLDVLKRAGLARNEVIDGRAMIVLDLDDPEFVHARKRDEVMIDRLRKKDARNPSLWVPVRVRDGDQCRWCGRTVDWRARRGWRAGNIDSLNGHVDSTVDTLVVACHQCNDERSKGKELTLRPAPTNPYYTDHTIDLVNGNDWAKEQGIVLTPRQTSLDLDGTGDDAPTRQQTSGTAADTEGSAHAAAGPRLTGAPDHDGAPRQLSPGNDPLEDAPAWVTASMDELRQQQRERDAAERQQTSGTAADTEGSAHAAAGPRLTGAPDHDGAPDATERPAQREDNETVKPGPDLGRQGDESGLVGAGRDGQGRAGNGSVPGRRRKRRGRRGKGKS